MIGNQPHLVLEAKFVAKTYGGVEWPPSPFRLLQAIVSGCRDTSAPGLAWMAKQPPPLILASEEPAVSTFRISIPNNADRRKESAMMSMREVRHRHVEQPVRYVYALSDIEDTNDARALIESSLNVHTLGVGHDMCAVRGFIVASQPESRAQTLLWSPVPVALTSYTRTPREVLLRVPVPESLASLAARFEAFQGRLNQEELGYGRPVSPAAAHGQCIYRPDGETPRNCVVSFKLTQVDDASRYQRFHIENTVIVAGMLRHSLMKAAGEGALMKFAAGYGPDTDPGRRASWVPVPTIGVPFADGMVRRAMLVARATDLPDAKLLCDRIPASGLPLIDEGTGELVGHAEIVPRADDAVFGAFLRPSSKWSTVTPMILPGDHGGGDLRVAGKLVRKAVREAGIDPGLIDTFELSKHPFRKQSPRIGDVRLKAWRATNLILYYVQINWRTRLAGPVVLGRGRHFGLGLCCADPE